MSSNYGRRRNWSMDGMTNQLDEMLPGWLMSIMRSLSRENLSIRITVLIRMSEHDKKWWQSHPLSFWAAFHCHCGSIQGQEQDRVCGLKKYPVGRLQGKNLSGQSGGRWHWRSPVFRSILDIEEEIDVAASRFRQNLFLAPSANAQTGVSSIVSLLPPAFRRSEILKKKKKSSTMPAPKGCGFWVLTCLAFIPLRSV